ncbi:signal peptidase I [Streptomyces filamentosus]|uniref:signal peptidase I n=1 Tax=Streptomyces filamentosus TaxID=67294 RepID=UPI00331867A9
MASARRARTAARIMVPLGLVLVLGGTGTFLVTHRGVTVAGSSMQPAYPAGARLFVERVGGGEVRGGDVVLVRVPEHYGELPVLRRVAGTGGDHVVSDGHRVTVNGRVLDEPYAKDDPLDPSAEPYDVRVPEGRLFLLGDDRANANDSRAFLDDHAGGAPASAVLGRVRDGLPPSTTAACSLGAVLTAGGLGLAYTARRRARTAAGR